MLVSERIKEGTQSWNRWRSANPDVKVEMAGVDLRECVLPGINLSEALLRGAILRHSVLNEADLGSAQLDQSDLGWSRLVRARLDGASLRNADLSNSTLLHADFTDANLTGVNLAGAIMFKAKFIGSCLKDAANLDQCIFWGPCGIDLAAIQASWPLPSSFLRGCGLPQAYIDFIPSLIGKTDPLQFHSCFISYSSRDGDFARRLHADLTSANVRSWFAPEDLRIGEKTRHGIDEAIRVHDKVLLVLSEQSVFSQWVEQEVETALEKERDKGKLVLFPIRLDDAIFQVNKGWPKLIKNSRNIGDFTGWRHLAFYQKAFDRLLQDLRAAA